MDISQLTEKDKTGYNKLVTHVMQSWQWGEFRESLGTKVYRYGIFDNKKLISAFQITFHKIPFTKYHVGYLPKGPAPDKDLADALKVIGKKHCCAFIKIEPNIKSEHDTADHRFLASPKPLFTKFNFILDLTKSESELLKNMYPKFRYNIKVAQKHGVIVEERTDEKGLQEHLRLYFDTTKRQRYFGHNPNYYRHLWQTLIPKKMVRILIAYYKPEGSDKKIPLASWMLFNFRDTLYYPYGGSSDQHRNVMASNLLAWEAIRLGQKMGLKKLDLWGALGPNANPKHPWQGFTRFKKQLGAELVEYIGTFDMVFNYPLYKLFTKIDKATSLKALLLRLIGK